MEDFICFNILDQVHPYLLSFAVEDYQAVCADADIAIPPTATILGFCLSAEFNPDLFSRSLRNLLCGLNTNDISIIVIDYSYLLSHLNITLNEVTDIMNPVMKSAGFEIIAPFDSTYENRIVYIGNTTDGVIIKDWLKYNQNKYRTDE